MLHLFGASTYYFILNLSTIYAFTSRLPCLTLASLLTSLCLFPAAPSLCLFPAAPSLLPLSCCSLSPASFLLLPLSPPLPCCSSLLLLFVAPLCWRLVFAEDDAFYFVNLVFELLVGVDHVGYGFAAVKHCCVVSSTY